MFKNKFILVVDQIIMFQEMIALDWAAFIALGDAFGMLLLSCKFIKVVFHFLDIKFHLETTQNQITQQLLKFFPVYWFKLSLNFEKQQFLSLLLFFCKEK